MHAKKDAAADKGMRAYREQIESLGSIPARTDAIV